MCEGNLPRNKLCFSIVMPGIFFNVRAGNISSELEARKKRVPKIIKIRNIERM